MHTASPLLAMPLCNHPHHSGDREVGRRAMTKTNFRKQNDDVSKSCRACDKAEKAAVVIQRASRRWMMRACDEAARLLCTRGHVRRQAVGPRDSVAASVLYAKLSVALHSSTRRRLCSVLRELITFCAGWSYQNACLLLSAVAYRWLKRFVPLIECELVEGDLEMDVQGKSLQPHTIGCALRASTLISDTCEQVQRQRA